MMKKILVIGLVVLAGLFVVRKTHIGSYACTLLSQVRHDVKAQVPTQFELDRIRNEINKMDGDIKDQVSPIAEHMAGISKLKRDIDRNRTALAESKTRLLTMTTALQKGDEGDGHSAARLRRQLQRDFGSYKTLESNLATQEKLLAAKERALDAAREQLSKLIAKRDEFRIRLAQMEAEQQILEAAKTGTDLRVDNGRATQIQADLDEIAHRQEVLRHQIELLTGQVTEDGTTNQGPPVNVDEIRTYLQGNGSGETQTAKRK